MKRAAIFDLDGTVAATLEAIAHCANKAIGDFGYEAYPIESYKTFAGDGARTLVERALAGRGVEDTEIIDKVFARYLEIFAVDCLYNAKAYDGIPELLKELRDRGVKTAVLSNKPHPESIKTVDGILPKGSFDIIRGVKDGCPKKPAPDGAFAIAKEFGVEPSECIYLGDTNTDMKTGKAAGMFTIGVSWGFRPVEELTANHADVIIDHPLDALNYI